MMSDNNTEARRILHKLDLTVTPKVKRNAALVKEFLEELSHTFAKETIRETFKVSIVPGSNSDERLAVTNKVDFDATIAVLGDFAPENFEVFRDKSDYFILKRKYHFIGKEYDCMGHVDAGKLRRNLFAALRRCSERVLMPNAAVTCRESYAALTVQIDEFTGLRRRVSVNLVPRIPISDWGQCPDLMPRRSMPQPLRCYIDMLQRTKSPIMAFGMGVPSAETYSNAYKLFSVSFSLLEKEFINSNVNLRAMVRMTKHIAERRHWRLKYAFQPSYAERVAVKYCEELLGRRLWDGTKMLLAYLSQEVGTGVLDGYFVSRQVLRKWTFEEARLFRNEIERVRSMDVRDI